MSVAAIYEPSPINSRSRLRRTQADLRRLDEELLEVLAAIRPATLRQLFYAATVRSLVPKTEAGYDLVGRRMVLLRRRFHSIFDWVVDNTRWMRKPNSYTGLDDLLERSARLYRRDLWIESPERVEIWVEKDALAGVIYPITDEYDVPLMVTRGYSSLTFAYSSAMAIVNQRIPTHLYYFGDHDPSGVDIDRALQRYLEEFGATQPVWIGEVGNQSPLATLERVAVLPWQIVAWNLPTRPTKRSDSRAAGFEGDSVELDAIPPDQLRALVREVIERHIESDRLERVRRVEEQERESLANIAAAMRDGDT